MNQASQAWQAEVLVAGQAQGKVLRFDAPISFWGGIDPATSRVTLAGHPQEGQHIADKMLVLPQLVGSSSSSAVMLELIHVGLAPRALILGTRDAILPIGVVTARQMGWPTLPVVVLTNPPLSTGLEICVAEDGHITTL